MLDRLEGLSPLSRADEAALLRSVAPATPQLPGVLSTSHQTFSSAGHQLVFVSRQAHQQAHQQTGHQPAQLQAVVQASHQVLVQQHYRLTPPAAHEHRHPQSSAHRC